MQNNGLLGCFLWFLAIFCILWGSRYGPRTLYVAQGNYQYSVNVYLRYMIVCLHEGSGIIILVAMPASMGP